jgi:signal transduction histidine kinase
MLYNKKFEKILEKLSQVEDDECQAIQKEMTDLSDLYRKKDARLNKIIKLSDKQQMSIIELNEELDSYRERLEHKVEEEIEKRLLQEDLLLEQSRLASIAEMIDAVAHQWVQPLNILSMQIELLKMETIANRGATQDRVQKFNNDALLQINHLSDSLDNFRKFFRPTQRLKNFLISQIVESVQLLVKDEFEKYDVDIKVDIVQDFELLGNENEFKHIIINIINNAKHIFLARAIDKRDILIRILGDKKEIEIIDNAGGIDEKIIGNIFKMNTTSETKGSGIGLYMSQKIAHKHHGFLSVENVENGAKFIFKLHKEKDNAK